MAWRTGANAPLGCPDPNSAHDTNTFPLGSIIQAFDATNGINAELIWLETGADHTAGEDVDISSSYVTSDAVADTGAADAIVASSTGQFAWFQLKPRQPLA